MKNQHQFEKDLFLTGNVASATECTGRNATQPVNSEMEESFEDIYKTPPKPKLCKSSNRTNCKKTK